VERLFVSSKAALDGSKAIRGGIPVVFPCFGPPSHPDHAQLPQHGFARNEIWSWDGQINKAQNTVSVELTLEQTPKISAIYSKPFRLTYVVTLGQFELGTQLNVTNTSSSTFFPPDALEFQALFHNYIRAPSKEVLVTPLRGILYYDKTEPTEEGKTTAKTESRLGVDVRTYTDSVYENCSQDYEVTWPGGGMAIKTAELKDLVIWNPQAEAGSKISDMEAGGWERFVCCEPGLVRPGGFLKVNPGETWIGKQVLSVIHEERRITQL